MPFIRAADKPHVVESSPTTPQTLPIADRGNDGRFMQGHSGNPAGRPAGLPQHWQHFPARAAYLLDKYTVGEIMDLVQDREALRKLPSRDGQIIMRIAKTLTSKGDATYWNMLDRMEGYKKAYDIPNVGDEIPPTLTVQQVFVGEMPKGLVYT